MDASAWLDLVGSTVVYWGLHTMIKNKLPKDLIRALHESQRVQRVEVTPRRLAIKLCGAVQVIVAFVLGVLVVRDVTRPPPVDDVMAALEPRVRVSWLLLPVRSGGSPYTQRALLLTAGFWVFAAASDVRRLLFAFSVTCVFWGGSGRRRKKRAPSLRVLAESLRLLSLRFAPLWCTWVFVRWRARKLAEVAASRGGGSSGSFGTGSGDSHLDNGLGFPDLLVAISLCSLLPALLDNTRWIVHAIDPLLAPSVAGGGSSGAGSGGGSDGRKSLPKQLEKEEEAHSSTSSSSSFEARFLDAAVAVNTLVCQVFVWPFMLLAYHRHTRGGLRDPEEEERAAAAAAGGGGGLFTYGSAGVVGGGIVEEVPLLEAIVDALLALPWRCSVGTVILFAVSVRSFLTDAVHALGVLPLRSRGTTASSRKESRPSPASEPTNNGSELQPKEFSNLERGGEYVDPLSPGFPPNGNPFSDAGSSSGGGGGSPRDDDNDDDVDDLPPALLRLASTPEEVDWLRAQKRISRTLKDESRKESESSEKHGNEAGPSSPFSDSRLGGRKWD